MKKFLYALVLGFTTLFLSGSAQALRVEPSFVISSSPQLMTYGSTTFYCYPNHLIVPTNYYYSKRAIRDMARLTRYMGWSHAYILSPRHQHGMPLRYQRYAHKQFYRHGVSYNYYYPGDHTYHHSYRKVYPRDHYYHDRSYRRSGIYFRFSF